ncbi:transglycosylase domain-containing protein [Bacillus weihaiensis]
MVPAFILSGIAAGNESQAVKGLGTILDEKIPIQSVALPQNSYVFDDNGRLISEMISSQQNRVYVQYEDIPKVVVDLYVLSEDQRFFEHIGFDAEGMLRAALVNAQNQSVEQGGSTITQQLARNVYLSHEQSYNRKLSELLYSYQLEKTFTKEQILESYLNAIYFSHGTYGIGTASTYFFQKQLQELNLAQLVFISAIPNNPTMYDPVENFQQTKERQERLLDSLHEHGVISTKEAQEAKSFPIVLSIKDKMDTHPDYVTYVHQELKELIAEQEGFAKKKADGQDNEELLSKRVNEIISQGVIVHTALNTDIQNKLQASILKHIPASDAQGAAAVINHQSHTIVALSGGKDYEKFTFNRAYQAYRHPGSTIKPLLDYAPYIDLTGATANSKIDSSEFCTKDYCPKNYNEKNYGTVTLDTAFKYSYNTAAVRMLDTIGIDKGFDYLNKFDFHKITQKDQRLTAAIGGFDHGVSPLELANAYSTFGNNGIYTTNHAITKVTDLQGKTLYQWEEAPVRVWKESTNNEMKKLLASVVKSGTGRSAYVSKEYVGGKTGTSNDYKDLWFAGLTDSHTAAIWIGKDKGGNVSSLHKYGPQNLIFKDIMD